MSRHDPLWYLRDMIAFGREAIALHDRRDEADQDSLRVALLAAERLLEIVGEAARSVPAELRDEYPSIPWSQITGMRNVLIHAYHRIEPEEVWKTLGNDLPPLIPLLENVLRAEEDRRAGHSASPEHPAE
jgi:uncharacterized protein with HEPN domain